MSDLSVAVVSHLTKHYRRPAKSPGLAGSLSAFVHPRWQQICALEDVSFTLSEGEVVGYVGPNGAGKTTTLKLMAGVLYPSAGEVSVLGYTPHRRQRPFLRQISFVMSGRGLLEEVAWDLSIVDGLDFVRHLYGLSAAEYRRSRDELVAMLGIADLLAAPLRQLSHGQRARAELAAALLWRPRLLLLDEPTLGLDLVSQQALRQFVCAYVKGNGAACIVTSHNMRDIESMADRLLLVEQGHLADSGSLAEVIARLSRYRLLKADLDGEPGPGALEALGRVLSRDGSQVTLEVERQQATAAAQALLGTGRVRDLTIEEPDLETVLLRHLPASDQRLEEGV
jgi:ABC-2 type transport system ATP-binding protein